MADELLDRAAFALELTMERLSGLRALNQVSMNEPEVRAAAAAAHVGITASAAGSSSASGTLSVTHSSDDEVLDNPRIVQMRQIVGYDKVISVQAESLDTFDVQLSSPLTGVGKTSLQVLADEQSVSMRFHFDNTIFEARPTGSV